VAPNWKYTVVVSPLGLALPFAVAVVELTLLGAAVAAVGAAPPLALV